MTDIIDQAKELHRKLLYSLETSFAAFPSCYPSQHSLSMLKYALAECLASGAVMDAIQADTENDRLVEFYV
jgi:hypothetical protein